MTSQNLRSPTPQEIQSKSVWRLKIPEIRFGTNSIEELQLQPKTFGVFPPAHGLVLTNGELEAHGQVDRIEEILSESSYSVDIFQVPDREPYTTDVEEVISFIDNRNTSYDFYIGLGGGSILDLSKVVASAAVDGLTLNEFLNKTDRTKRTHSIPRAPLIAVPTTGGNAAMISSTAVLKNREDDKKRPVTHESLRPRTTILDPVLTTTLPSKLSAETVMDALCPAIESFTALSLKEKGGRETETNSRHVGRTEVSEMFSKKAIELLSDNIRDVINNGSNLRAREQIMLGSLYSSIAVRLAGSHLGHATAYTIQNLYGTRHAVSVGVMTASAVFGHFASIKPSKFQQIASILGADVDDMCKKKAAMMARGEFIDLQNDLGVLPSGLEELAGISGDIEEVGHLAKYTLENSQRLLDNCPRRISEGDLKRVFRQAINYNIS